MNNEGQIKGIERNVPRAVSEEISTWEILNLRPVQGGWRPVGRKPVEISGVPGTALHVHVMDTVHNLVSINNSTLYFKNLETGITKTLAGIEGELLDINHLGGILVVSTSVRKYEFMYNWDDEEYILFQYPADLKISIRIGTENKHLESAYAEANLMVQYLVSEYKKYHLEQRIEGNTIGFMIVRYAIELIDGTYIYPSLPVECFLKPGTQSISIARSIMTPSNNGWYWDTGVSWLTVYFPTNLGDLLNQYRNIIAGIAIFGTTPRDPFGDELVIDYYSGESYIARLPLSENITDNLIEKESFSLLERFSIDDIIRITGELEPGQGLRISPNYEILDSQEKLIIDDEKLHKTRHHTSMIYNKRLLTGNIITQLFEGWNFFTLAENPTGWSQIIFEFEIKTSFGIKKVQRRRLCDFISYFEVPRLIAYPDIRAICVNIYLSINTTYFFKALSAIMKPHSTQNFAYCFLKKYTHVQDAGTQFLLYWDSGGWDNAILDPVLPADSSVFTDPNRVQASETGNPLVMPYKNSEQVGNSSILGFAANGEPVSEGQFGEYPIYVFTREGMYMMDVGADPFISSVRQINGEVCNSPKTIKNIGAGVLFTTDKGLMVINSLQVNSLSVNFEQEQHNDYAVRHNPLYKKAIALEELGNPGRFVSTAPFMDYLVGSNIGYDYPNREIWVNNPDYPYSYVYSIEYQTWSKRDETFTTIVDDYPRYYAQQGASCKNLSAKEGLENTNIFLLSNPVKIRLDEFKQFRRTVVRGEFPVERMGLYLFGSIDGFSWAYISGKEIEAPEPATPVIKARDAIYLGTHKSVKYVALVVEGVVTHEWNLTHISETVESVMNKKLI